MSILFKSKAVLVFAVALILTSFIACSEKIVEVPVEVIKVVEKEVIKEVVVEKVVKELVTFPLSGSELIVVGGDVGAPLYRRAHSPEPMISYPYQLGVAETMLDYDGFVLTPMIAHSWTLDDAGIVFNFRDDVPWHLSEYGNVTPEDQQHAYNEMIKALNGWITEYYVPLFENQRVDGSSIKWDWAAGQSLSWAVPARHVGSGVQPESKAYFDEKGAEHVNLYSNGTGPYRVVHHSADDYIELEGVANHWRMNPGYEKVRVLEVPEPTTLVAMLLSGDANLGQVGQAQLDQVAGNDEFTFNIPKTAKASGSTVTFGGIWRIRVDQLTGENTISVYDDSLPWVGTLGDADSVAKATKVRKAMSVGIDRNLINTEILSGSGCIAYTAWISDCSPAMKERWRDPYDKDLALQLLAEAGYPDGFTGPGKVWIPSDANSTFVEVSTAVWDMWCEIGVCLQIDSTSEGVGSAKLAHGRAMNDVWFGTYWGSRDNYQVWGGLMACFDTTIEYSCGWDDERVYDIHSRMLDADNPTDGWKVVDEFLDIVHDDYLTFSIVFWMDPIVADSSVGEVGMHHRGANFPEIERIFPALD